MNLRRLNDSVQVGAVAVDALVAGVNHAYLAVGFEGRYLRLQLPRQEFIIGAQPADQ
jgi:hypothetical protein